MESSSGLVNLVVPQVYVPGKTKIPEGEDDVELTFDPRAYVFYHSFQTGFPCLSFDFVYPKNDSSNSDGTNESFPIICYFVSGTQTSASLVPQSEYSSAVSTSKKYRRSSQLIVSRLSNLHPFKAKSSPGDKESVDNSDDDSSDDDSDTPADEIPVMKTAALNLNSPINRIRSAHLLTGLCNRQVAATFSENGKVQIWDLDPFLEKVDADETDNFLFNSKSSGIGDIRKPAKGGRIGKSQKGRPGKYQGERADGAAASPSSGSGEEKVIPKPLQTFGHLTEGFALDWSPLVNGRLASGDCAGKIHVWEPHESKWTVDQRPFVGHRSSVEDIQWSPNEKNVFASCSVDKSIRIYDIRCSKDKACQVTCENAHSSDVNVISWSKLESFLASGGDDHVIKIWDLRQFRSGRPCASFSHHTAPITSIEWSPHESSVFAAAGEDNQVTIWDLAVEVDEEGLDDRRRQSPPTCAGDDSSNSKSQSPGGASSSCSPSQPRQEQPQSTSSSADAPKVDVPQQLLFIHQGQEEVKELHWHKDKPGAIMTTSLSGFNFFRTISSA